jgi:hypothetical protein
MIRSRRCGEGSTMTHLVGTLPPDLKPPTAAPYLADLGFMASCDLPDRPGPAYLLAAIRPIPTLRHYDPEWIEYWTTAGGRGTRCRLTRETRLPVEREFSWGLIRIVDRLKVSNEYLTFGGRLAASVIDDAVIAVFTSPAPILRRGGHSQGWDQGAERVGGFFGRMMPAVDFVPGLEGEFAAATPIARFAAFIADTVATYRHQPTLREGQQELWALLQAEERRLRLDHPDAYRRGLEILARAATVGLG